MEVRSYSSSLPNDPAAIAAAARGHRGIEMRLPWRWAPEAFTGFQKSSTHLALDDIRDSIRELAHYRSTFLRVP